MHTWNNKKSDFKVDDLVTEMRIWQQQDYLDRKIWLSKLFSPNCLSQNSSTPKETGQETHASPITSTLSGKECEAFENEQLDPAVWVSKIYQHFNIEELKLLKDLGKDKINGFLDGFKDTTTQRALKSLMRELKCLYVPQLEIENLTDLPGIINDRKKYLILNRGEGDKTRFNELIDQIECTLWKWEQTSSQSCEFLVCLATLSLFDCSVEELSFSHVLEEKELEQLTFTLREHFQESKTLKKNKNKQAFLFNIALNNPFDKKKIVDYILKKIPDKISSKFSSCTVDRFDLEDLEKSVKGILSRKYEKALKEKEKSLSMHFNCIFSKKFRESHIHEESGQVKESVQRLLEDLGLTEYYPQKLSYGDVIKLTEDVLKDVNEKPSSLHELPWFFMRRLVGLNSKIREKGSAIGKKPKTESRTGQVTDDNTYEESDFSWDDDSSEGRYTDDEDCTNQESEKSTISDFDQRLIGLNSNITEKGSIIGTKRDRKRKRNRKEKKSKKKRKLSDVEDEEISFSWYEDSEEEDNADQNTDSQHSAVVETIGNVMNSVHPLDLIYIIFLCADDFLRQELANKLSKCQYAVPFILPPAEEGAESQNTVLNWGLQAISRTYREDNGPAMTNSLLKVCCPVISCLSLNINTTWKSKLLNEMLSPKQDTFWHEALEGGERIQKVSQGMVEVSWYLPAGRGNDEFKTPLTFTNLRGDAHQHPLVAENLIKMSTSTCILTDKINKEVFTFLNKHFPGNHLIQMILVVLYNPAEERKHIKNIKKLKQKLQLDDHQIISCSMEDSNFYNTYDILKNSLQTSIEENILRQTSLQKFTEQVKSSGCMKVDDVACSDGYMAAQRILSDIDTIDSDNVKSKILPCQSDIVTREMIGKHDKEICRQKEIAERVLMTQHVTKEEEEKWQLQWKQLQYPMSDTFTHFLRCVTNFDSINRKYFLQSLKLGLNERSTELLQPLYEEYQKCRCEEKSKARDVKLRELNEQLMYSSLGLEHFFREIAVMYENMAILSEKIGSNENHLVGILERLAKTMADIFLEGEAVELLDGDAVYSPILWLKAVLNQIENKERLRIFKVSALGAQSSGKSTLLNTVFGLNFPVSSGRCTKGAYMQLVKIDEQIAKRLQCDYLLVIDSEGLMSRVSKNEDYDNELATFVIGLSDLTLVIIKGEGNEMQDVLPIAIHVFLRMNVLGELQACHFVHQNMGAVDVEKTMPIEIDTFVQLLDEKTRAAAQEAWKKKYRHFTDVLHYDKNKENTYVCGLWDSSPPMGKVDIEYSNTMHRLKGKIFERLENVVKKKLCSTLQDFSKWMVEIWEAVKYENFVFSFRNVLAVEAYKRLSTILNDKEWKIKTTIREEIEKKKKEIKDAFMTEKDSDTAKSMIDNMTGEVTKNITDMTQNLWTCISHYFHCPGCQGKDCSQEVRNRQFLRDYKGHFEHDILKFRMALEEEIDQSGKSFAVELSSNEDSAKMDGILKQKVQEIITRTSSESFSEKDKETIFDEMWKSGSEEILSKIHQKVTSETFIRTTVEKVIRDSLGSEYFMYNRKKAENSNMFDKRGIVIKQDHVNGDTKLAPHTLRILMAATRTIMEETRVHYRKVEKGREFETKYAETLFKEIQNGIDCMKRSDLETALNYKVDLMMHIEELAVKNFCWNQRAYEENRCPRKLLEKKRDVYHEVFLIATCHEDPVLKFCSIILKLIRENLEDRMRCTGLLQILRDQKGDIFKSAEALQTSSIMKVWSQNGVREYHLSMEKYEEMIKETITEKSVACFEEGDHLKKYAKSNLNSIITELKDSIQKTVQCGYKSKDFIGTLFLNMKGLKKPHNDIEAYKVLEVDDKVHFADVLITQLMGPMQKQLLMDIQSWKVARIVQSIRLTEFTFREIIGRRIYDGLLPFNQSSGKYISVVPYHTERHAEQLVAHTYDDQVEFEGVEILIQEDYRKDM